MFYYYIFDLFISVNRVNAVDAISVHFLNLVYKVFNL